VGEGKQVGTESTHQCRPQSDNAKDINAEVDNQAGIRYVVDERWNEEEGGELVLSSIIVVLCSSRYLSVTVQHLAWNARPGLAPIQSLPPLVYSVYSRQRQQFSADARLVRDAHREKFRGSIDFDIGGKRTARLCRYCTVSGLGLRF
jgi:hypothetical protein